MWIFLDNHPAIAIIFGSILLVMLGVMIFFIARAIKRNGIKAKFGDNEIEIDGGNKKNHKRSEQDAVRDAILLCNAVNQWKSQLNREIEEKTKDVVRSSIRQANSVIDNTINVAKLEYGSLLKEDGRELTVEDNYQIIICGFLMDQIREIFKDIICGAIREDHFADKTPQELSSIGENAFIKAKVIFEEKQDILKKSILDKIAVKYEPKVKTLAGELIEMTSKKYKDLNEDIEKIIEDEEKKFRMDLTIKFPQFSNEITNNLVTYYS